MENRTDTALLERWITGHDAFAFAEVLARHSGMVFRTCFRILGNAADAEEVSQDCFLELAVRRAGIKPSLGGWLHKAATHRALDRIRRRKRREKREMRYAENKPATTRQPPWDDVKAYVDEEVAALPEKHRAAVVAHFLEGRTYEAIGLELGLPASTVASRAKRGIELVREALGRRGAFIAVTALVSALSHHAAEAAPISLTASLGKIAIAGSGGTTTASLSAGKIALGGMIVSKKLIVGCAIGFAVFTASLAVLQRENGVSTDRAAVPVTETAPAAATGRSGHRDGGAR